MHFSIQGNNTSAPGFMSGVRTPHRISGLQNMDVTLASWWTSCVFVSWQNEVGSSMSCSIFNSSVTIMTIMVRSDLTVIKADFRQWCRYQFPLAIFESLSIWCSYEKIWWPTFWTPCIQVSGRPYTGCPSFFITASNIDWFSKLFTGRLSSKIATKRL